MNAHHAPSLQDIFYEFAVAQEIPDAALLDDFIRRYPEHAKALTDFAIALALESAAATKAQPAMPSDEPVSSAVSKAMSQFHSRLYDIEQAASGDTPAGEIPNPFASLSTAEIRALGIRLNANTVFAMKLRDRGIRPDTLSHGFLRHVASTMDVPVALVQAHFAGESHVSSTAFFKSEQKPEATEKEAFDEAVRTSGLDTAQQEFLLNL